MSDKTLDYFLHENKCSPDEAKSLMFHLSTIRTGKLNEAIESCQFICAKCMVAHKTVYNGCDYHNLQQELDAERTTKNILRDTYEKLEQELADTKKKKDELRDKFEQFKKDTASTHGLILDELESFKKEALVIITQLAQSPHPYTIHEHRDTLEHRFGLQIEVARSFLQKHTKNIGDETKKISEQTKMEG